MAFSDLVAGADRAAIAALGDGVTVTYTPTVGAPPPAPVAGIAGIFEATFTLAEGDAHAGVEATSPAVFLRLSDLPTDPQVDDPQLTIKGIVYRVVERLPDDMGGIVLTLRVVS